MKRVKKTTVPFYFCHSSPKAVQCQERTFWLLVSPVGEMRVREWRTPSFSSSSGCFQRVPFLSHPIQNSEVCQVTGGQRVARSHGGHQRDTDPTNRFVDSIRKPIPKPLGCLVYNPTNWLAGSYTFIQQIIPDFLLSARALLGVNQTGHHLCSRGFSIDWEGKLN